MRFREALLIPHFVTPAQAGVHFDLDSIGRKPDGLRAAPAARPSGHRLRGCSLRHPAFEVRLSPE
jgi:hypothetical protein